MAAPRPSMEPKDRPALPNETTMIIVPGLPPLQQTRHSRELGKRVEQLVRDYQRENPDVTEGDVRTAMAQLSSGGPSSDTLRRKRALLAVVGGLTAAGFGMMASTGGKGFENNPLTFRIIGLIAGVCAVVFVAISLARRD